MTNEEKMFELMTKMYSEMQKGFEDLNLKFQDLNLKFEDLNLKVDKNHTETITRLSRLEENQNAIKEFILNSDDTFKKSEEAYNVIQKFKEALSK